MLVIGNCSRGANASQFEIDSRRGSAECGVRNGMPFLGIPLRTPHSFTPHFRSSAGLLGGLEGLRRLHPGVLLVRLEAESRRVEPDLGLLVGPESGARRDQVAQDDVLL